MKPYIRYFWVCILILLHFSSNAQNRCWNDKRISKEWFITALGGYTFGYGMSNTYWKRDIKDYVPNNKFNPYYVHNAKGWGISAGAGVYFNKSIGIQVICNYLFGHHYKVSANYTSRFSSDVWSKLYDSYQASSNGIYYVRTWSVAPALLYRYQLSKFSVYAMMGFSIAITQENNSTTSIEQIYYRNVLVEEHRYVHNTQNWRKNDIIAGIYCGLGSSYPISNKVEILAQVMMRVQKMYGFFERYNIHGPHSLDGIEVSIGVKYNLFNTNLNK